MATPVEHGDVLVEFAADAIQNLFDRDTVRKRPVNFRIAAKEGFRQVLQLFQIARRNGELFLVTEKGPAPLREKIHAEVAGGEVRE